MPELKLIKPNQSVQKLPSKQADIDMMVERLDTVLNWIILHDDEECSYNWLLTGSLTDLVKAKALLLAWHDEEY